MDRVREAFREGLGHINNSREVGDVDHLKVFANEEAAEKWFAENDPEGVAFMYDVNRMTVLLNRNPTRPS
jgi:hypothetical protein